MNRCALAVSILLALPAAGLCASGTSLSKSDAAFVKMAADANMTEAHIGQVAENQGILPGVKDLGRTMVTDHTNAYEELSEVAEKVGATIPKGIDIAKDLSAEHMIHMKGSSFDRTFIRDEVTSHRQAIAAFQREAEHGENAELRDYAKKMIPVLEKHLHAAEDLSKKESRS